MRHRILIAAVVFGVLVTLTTEVLSLFRFLHCGGFILSWLLHLEVQNFTRVLTTPADANFCPCAVIAIGVFGEELFYKKTRYQGAYADPRVSVYLAAGPRPEH